MTGNLHIITGAAGFIGRCLAKRLLDAGSTVVGFDNLCRGTRANVAEFEGNPRFSLTLVDCADAAAFETALTGALQGHDLTDAMVWHLAANSDIPAGVKDSEIDFRDTFLTSYNTVNAMRRRGLKKIAFASTSAVYGPIETTLHEDIGPLFPISNYGAMKLASEAVISAGVESFLEQAWIYRFPNVIGPYATHGVIYDFARKLRRDPSGLEVLGDGNQQKAYLLVDELVDAMQFIRDNAHGRLNYFNIGPIDDGVTVRFISEEMIKAASPGAAIRYTGGAKGWVGDVPKFTYSTAKLAALGWKPRIGSAEAIRTAIPQIWAESA